MKQKIFWAGYSDGKLMLDDVDTGFGGFGENTTKMPAIFLTRAAARREYHDVRKVKVVEIKS